MILAATWGARWQHGVQDGVTHDCSNCSLAPPPPASPYSIVLPTSKLGFGKKLDMTLFRDSQTLLMAYRRAFDLESLLGLQQAQVGFPGGSVVKNLPISTGDVSLIPGLGRSPGGRHGNPLQYSCLENPMDQGAWRAMVHRVTKSWAQLK